MRRNAFAVGLVEVSLEGYAFSVKVGLWILSEEDER